MGISGTESVTTKRILFQAILIAILAQSVSFFLYPVSFWLGTYPRFTKQYEPLTHNPWNNEITESPAARHRILGPVIAHYLGLHGLISAGVPMLGGTLMLFLSYLVLRRATDHRWAAWSTFLIATGQVLISSQTSLGYQDALGGAAVAAGFMIRRPWLGALCLLIGMFGDERCAAAVPFIILWHFDNGQPGRWKRAILWAIFLTVAVAVWTTYFLLARKHLLPAAEVNNLEGASLQLFRANYMIFPLGVFESIRGAWILIGYSLYLMASQRKWIVLIGCTLGIIACLFQSGFVLDISRSASVVWPMIIISIREMYRQSSDLLLVKAAVLLNLFSPCYQIIGSLYKGEHPAIMAYLPLPFSLARWLMGN